MRCWGMPPVVAPEGPWDVTQRIRVVRGARVLVDSDLAEIYGVATKRLNEARLRNARRFPADFAFRVTAAEAEILRSQFATSSSLHGGRRHLPWVFTEHGALMAASVLNSSRAVQMSIYVVRAFVRLKSMLASSPQLAAKLAELERDLRELDRETRAQFEEVYTAIRALTSAPASRSRPIGFTAPIE